MVRTKADRVPAKAVGNKAPKVAKGTPVKKSTGSSKGKNYSGGNPYHPRETPDWQKPITSFFNQKDGTDSSEAQDQEEQSINEEAGSESD